MRVKLEAAWPLLGYAPGDYMCHCVICEAQFEGDKRAVMCLECAVRAANKTLAALPATGAVTEEERAIIHELAADIRDREDGDTSVRRNAQRIIELSRPRAMLAASPPIPSGGEPEPVAYIVHETDVHGRDHWFCDASDYASKVEAHIAGIRLTPLFASPPKPSEAMVERAARAMCVEHGYDADETMPNDGPRWKYYVPSARAALTAALSGGGE